MKNLRLCALGAACAIFLGSPASANEKVEFDSFTPEDYAEIVSGAFRAKPARIHGGLTLPAGATRPVPAVVIVPGSGGVRDWMLQSVAAPLNKAGIATFVVDSFAGRGVGEVASDQGRVPVPASVMDGFSALAALAKRPEIDARRIGIAGFSRGGIAAMFTAETRLAQAALPAGLAFAAHMPFYPGCGMQWRSPRPTAAPIRFLLGGKDDNTPAAKCIEYAAKLAGAGARTTTKIYPEAFHGWVSDMKPTRLEIPVFAACEMDIEDDGTIVHGASGNTSRQGWRPFVTALMTACARRGTTFGEDVQAREDSIGEMVTFFRAALVR
jgi:dienelactone hydrolase